MSHPHTYLRASVAPLLALVLGVGGAAVSAFAADKNSVQNYADQAVPGPNPPAFYDTPLAAGTLTLRDVLEAHKAVDPSPPAPLAVPPAPVLAPPVQSSVTNLMMEQGLKSVLQKTDNTHVLVPSTPVSTAVAPSVASPVAETPVPSPPSTAALTFEPGRAPRNLAALPVDAASAVVSTAADTAAPYSHKAARCDEHTQKWEKTCVEAGYPASFVGKVVGETRVGCADGALHDFWVVNTCAPTTESGAGVKATSSSAAVSASVTASEAPIEVVRDDVPVDSVREDKAVPEVEAVVPVKAQAAPVKTDVASAHAVESSVVKDEFCGAASEILAYEKPIKDLCRVGAASVVNGDGPWTWSCTDNDGRVSSCRTLSLNNDAATTETPAAVAAEPAVPSAAPVASVSATPVTTPKAKAVSSNKAPAASPFGVGPSVPAPASTTTASLACGSAAATPVAQAPDQNLCEGGKASVVRGTGPWHWTCSAGKRKLTCQTPKTQDAVCGPANGMVASSAPFVGLCAVGTPTSVSGNGPWTWSCNGTGGGVTVACGATVPNSVATSTVPAVSVTPNPTPVHAFPAAPKVSDVPASAPAVTGNGEAVASPVISADNQPVMPSIAQERVSPAPVLQESHSLVRPASGRLTLDPTISTVLFTRGQGTIDPQVVSTLDKLAAVLTASADARITLIAYADSESSTPRDARRLSLTRALAVRDYLAGKGISNSRVDVRAEGANTTSGYIDRVDVTVNN